MKSLKFSGQPKKPSGQPPKKAAKRLIFRRVTGNSMLPTFRHGRIIVGSGKFRALGIGDVVVLEHEGLEKIKRIQHLRDTEMFVVGDNPRESTDSRAFGWLSVDLVCAKVIWPARLAARRDTSAGSGRLLGKLFAGRLHLF